MQNTALKYMKLLRQDLLPVGVVSCRGVEHVFDENTVALGWVIDQKKYKMMMPTQFDRFFNTIRVEWTCGIRIIPI